MYKLDVQYVLFVYFISYSYPWYLFTASPYFFYSSHTIRCPMITHRESYAYDTDCKFCAQETLLVAEINTRMCPDCYSWISENVGLSNLGIQSVAE